MTAPGPPKAIGKGLFSNGFIAMLLVERFAAGRSQNSLVTGLARHGAEISAATLAGTAAQAAGLLAPLAGAIAERNRESWHFHADETTWRVFCPGEGKGPEKFWLWVFIAADTVCFVMDPSRSGAVLARHAGLDEKTGQLLPAADGGPRRLVISSDFYAVYQSAGKKADGLVNLYCAAHIRRHMVRAGDASPVQLKYWTQNWLALFRDLYKAHDVRQASATRVEKMVTFYTSRDPAVSNTLVKAATSAARHTDFAATFERHTAAWDELWRVCDMRVSGNQRVQQLLRLHIAHVLQVCSRHTADLDAGMPARGLNGEAYRGHVFWDEIYAFPFFNVRLPEVTRGLLMYRYRRIGEARTAAREAGLRGAMFPWQSGSEGIEETQRVHLNPVSDRWEPDLSRNQRHVNAAIFYNIWHYFQTTNDQAFLRDYGTEMMLEITRFWASIAHFNPERERYEIHGVMGPDEFHDKYPDAPQGGLRNNAYTNVLVAWLCGIAGQLLALLPASRAEALRERLGIGDSELAVWQDMSRRMFVPFHGDGIISQFEGYEDLDELDWDAYRAKYGNIQRLDRILRAEGKDPNRYKVTKQADTVMLFFLFRQDELREIFGRLRYDYRADTLTRNVAYYDRRTSHGSTLSFVTHAGVLAAIDPESSWDRFLVALHSDADDIQDGTTKEGIHMGVMAGTLDLVQRNYAGAQVYNGVLHFDPQLPSRLGGLSFPMQFRETPIQVTLTGDHLTLAVHPEAASRPVRVAIRDDVRELCPGDQTVFELSRNPATTGPSARD